MPATPGNAVNITSAGLVKFDGTASFTGVTVTQHDVLVGAASNGITSVAPSSTSGVPLVSNGAGADPSFTTAVVAGGGTGAVTLTQHGVLLGQGTSAITATAVGATGTVLAGNTGADPTYQTLATVGAITTITGNSGGAESPSAGNFNVLGTGSITVVGSANTETVQLTGLTNHNVQVGAGTATLTQVAPSATSGIPLVSNGASADPSFTTAVVAGGGTGAVTLTAHGVLLGQGTSAVTAVSPGSTSGVPLIAQGASSDPVYGTAVVAGGGTGQTAFTSHSGLIASGTTDTGALQTIASVATGSVLTSAGTSTLPAWTNLATAGSSLVLISVQTANNTASISWNDTSFLNYFLTWDTVTPITSTATLSFQYTTDHGSTYVSTGYQSGLLASSYNSGSIGNANSTSKFILTDQVGNGAGQATFGHAYLYGFNSSGSLHAITGQFAAYHPGLALWQVGYVIGGNGNNDTANGIQITFSSGNISTGKFALYGIRQG